MIELRAQRDGQRAPGRSAPIGGPPGRFARASRPETAGFPCFLGIIDISPKFQIENAETEEPSADRVSNFRAGSPPVLLSCSLRENETDSNLKIVFRKRISDF